MELFKERVNEALKKHEKALEYYGKIQELSSELDYLFNQMPNTYFQPTISYDMYAKVETKEYKFIKYAILREQIQDKLLFHEQAIRYYKFILSGKELNPAERILPFPITSHQG
jgi:tetratricopeptide (TPR) repeat protein